MRFQALHGAALAIVCALALSACGQQQTSGKQATTASQYTRAETWSVTAEGASTSKTGDEIFTLTPGSRVGYQANYPVETGSGSTLVLNIDITMQGGPGAIGVLAGDRSHWLRNITMPAGERTTQQVRVPLEGGNVHLVLQTVPDTPAGTAFVVHDVGYSIE